MHTISFVEKAYMMSVDYEATSGKTVLGNIVIITERNIVTIRFLITILDLQPKQITIQEDHNIHTYSHVFCLVVLALENSRKPLLVICIV